MNRREYERELRKRQAEHLRRVAEKLNEGWQPCLHEQCTNCHGTGIGADGRTCIHSISCPCPKCSPR